MGAWNAARLPISSVFKSCAAFCSYDAGAGAVALGCGSQIYGGRMTVCELIMKLEELPQGYEVTMSIGNKRTSVDEVEEVKLCEEVVLS